MATHHLPKLRPSGLPIVVQVSPWQAHADLFIITRHQKTDIAQAIVDAGRDMALQLTLREDVVPVLPIGVADYAVIKRDGLSVFEIAGSEGGKETEEGASARRPRPILCTLDFENGVKAVFEHEPLGVAIPTIPISVPK